ncbi:MAG: hypothetical protein H5T91_02950 [Synergistetes bacterium]|nr:hypothetical protein [Synergistota bacterium]
MDCIEGIVASKLAMENLNLSMNVQASLLKKGMELQEEMLKTLLQSMGIGGNIDLTV